MSRKRPPTRLNIELHGGRTVSLQRPPRGGRAAAVRLLTPIAPASFTACPICLAPDPGTVEHIPPVALGGVPMTLTCGRCNHGLGSRLEAELADWFDDVIARCRFTSAAVPGRRQAGRVVLYQGTGDGFFLTLVGGDPAVRRGFVAGEFALEFSPPDPRRYRLALLKAAYLTWCLHVRTIPDDVVARDVRRALVKARDADRRDDLPTCEWTERLAVGRTDHGVAAPDRVPWTAVRLDGPLAVPGVVVGGSVFVAWPWVQAAG